MENITEERKTEIANALFEAVKDVMQTSNGYRICHYYAVAGSELLNHLYQTDKYIPVFYRYWFRLGYNKGDEVKDFKFDSWDSFKGKYERDERSFADHCYIKTRGGKTGDLIDFSTYSHKSYWENQWNVNIWTWAPQYWWGPESEIPPGYRKFFGADEAREIDVTMFLPNQYDPAITRQIVRIAISDLENHPRPVYFRSTEDGKFHFGGYSPF